MKKAIICAIIVSLAMSFSGCGGENPSVVSDSEPSRESGGEASSTVSSSSQGSSESSSSSSAEPINRPVSDNASDYVTVSIEDTGLGTVLCPVLNEKMLDEAEAKAANAAFRAASDELSENINMFLSEHPGATAADLGIYGNFCYAESSLENNILSVVLTCKRFVGDNSPAVICRDFDTLTGREMSYSETLGAAGFSAEEAEDSVRQYCKTSLEKDYWSNILSAAYLSGSLSDIDAAGKPNISEERVSGALDMFRNDAGKGVYIDMSGNAFIEARIPSDITGEYETRLVGVGRNELDIRRKNEALYNPFFPITQRGCLDVSSAADFVRRSVNFDFEPEFNVEYVEKIDGEYAYEICVYADLGSHAAVVGRYAVGALSPMLWKKDNVSDEWELVSARAEWLPNTWDAADYGAIAVVVKNPSDCDVWAANPVVDYYELGSGEPGAECFLIMAMSDGTMLGLLNDSHVILDSSEYILVHVLTGESCGGSVRITSIIGEGEYDYTDEDFHSKDNIVYITGNS